MRVRDSSTVIVPFHPSSFPGVLCVFCEIRFILFGYLLDSADAAPDPFDLFDLFLLSPVLIVSGNDAWNSGWWVDRSCRRTDVFGEVGRTD